MTDTSVTRPRISGGMISNPLVTGGWNQNASNAIYTTASSLLGGRDT